MSNSFQEKTPVLVIGYNRADLLEELLREVSLRERRVFVHIDGPKDYFDFQQIECVKLLDRLSADVSFQHIEVKILEKNLGCKHGVNAAINWAFEKCDEVIILEDDIRFTPMFLDYCDRLLFEYRKSVEIFAICGFSPIQRKIDSGKTETYFKSRNLFIWGWAIWKDRWVKVDLALTGFDKDVDIRSVGTLRAYKLNRFFSRFWITKLQRVLSGFDTWDVQVLFSMWQLEMKSLVPTRSLTTNVGFDERAAHTKVEPSIHIPNKISIYGADTFSRQTTDFVHAAKIGNSLDSRIDQATIGLKTKRGIFEEITNFIFRGKSKLILFGEKRKIKLTEN